MYIVIAGAVVFGALFLFMLFYSYKASRDLRKEIGKVKKED